MADEVIGLASHPRTLTFHDHLGTGDPRRRRKGDLGPLRRVRLVAVAGVASAVLVVMPSAVVMRLPVGRGRRRRGRDRPGEAACPAASERAASPPPIGRRLDDVGKSVAAHTRCPLSCPGRCWTLQFNRRATSAVVGHFGALCTGVASERARSALDKAFLQPFVCPVLDGPGKAAGQRDAGRTSRPVGRVLLPALRPPAPKPIKPF